MRAVAVRAAAPAAVGAQHGAGQAPARAQPVRAVVRRALAVVLAEPALQLLRNGAPCVLTLCFMKVDSNGRDLSYVSDVSNAKLQI